MIPFPATEVVLQGVKRRTLSRLVQYQRDIGRSCSFPPISEKTHDPLTLFEPWVVEASLQEE
jgi:hypothetical protein